MSLLRKAAYDGIGKTYAILVPIALAIVLFSPAMIYLLHGREYMLAAAILAFKVLTSAFLIPIGSGFSSIMNAIDQPKAITYLVIVSSLVNIVLSILLIYYIGLWGAAIAPMLTELVGFQIMKKKLEESIDFKVLKIMKVVKGYWNYWFKMLIRTSWKNLKFQL